MERIPRESDSGTSIRKPSPKPVSQRPKEPRSPRGDPLPRGETGPDVLAGQKPVGRIQGRPFVKGKGDVSDVDPNDVAQGQLGDCYLLAALAAVAKTDPGVIRQMVRDNGNGTYTVTFHLPRLGLSFLGREVRQVVVTPDVPVQSEGSLEPRYAQVGDRTTEGEGPGRKEVAELWVLLVEKAWAQVKGSYGAIEGGHPGQAMEAITGQASDSFRTDSKSETDLVKDLEAAAKAGHPVTAFTPSESRVGEDETWQKLAKEKVVYANHAYTVTGVEGREIRLRNPWGMRHPKPLSASEFKTLYLEVSINRA